MSLVRSVVEELLTNLDRSEKCGKCAARFRDKWLLGRHMRQKHGRKLKKLTCSKAWCKATFSTVYELRAHTKNCTFICEFCGKVISKNGREEIHMKSCAARN